MVERPAVAAAGPVYTLIESQCRISRRSGAATASVWMAGALYAAEAQADSDERATRALTAQEVEYLGCYLICTGHLWNDTHPQAAQAGRDL